MFSRFLRAFLTLGAFAIACSVAHAQTAITKETLNLEQAMRAWQERYVTLTGADQVYGLKNPNNYRPLTWPLNLKGEDPGPYPPNCFYAEDLQSPQRAAVLVASFASTIDATLRKVTQPGGLGVVRRFDSLWASWGNAPPTGPTTVSTLARLYRWRDPATGTYSFRLPTDAAWAPDFVIANITSDNYAQKFKTLVEHWVSNPVNVVWRFPTTPGDGIVRNYGVVVSGAVESNCNECVTCQTGCRPGELTCQNPNGPDFRINLGTGSKGQLGSLWLRAETPSALLYSPRSLVNLVDGRIFNSSTPTGTTAALPEAFSIYDYTQIDAAGLPLLRQLFLPQGLVDIVADATPNTGYTAYFYDPANRGTLVGNFYTPSTANAYKTVRVEPESGDINRLRIVENSGTPKTSIYVYASGAWSLVTGDGTEQRDQSVASTWTTGTGTSVGDVRQETHTLTNASSTIARKEAKTYAIFPWNIESSTSLPYTERSRRAELTQTITDPDSGGEQQLTLYRYYDDVATTDANYSRLKQVERWDGSWERYEYASDGRVTKTYASFNNSVAPAAAAGTPSGDYRLIETVYSTGTPQETTTETLRSGGTSFVVGRRFRAVDNTSATLTVFRDVVATSPSAAYGDATNLVTITRQFRTGNFAGRTERVVRPDGTVTLYQYSYTGTATSNTTLTVLDGVPNNADPLAANGVTDGTRVVTVTSPLGQVISEDTSDVAAGVFTLVDSVLNTDADSLGRFQTSLYLDGTTATRTFDCCGLESSTDRSGLRTEYDYDSHRRLQRATTYLGATSTKYSDVEYKYDAADRPTDTIRHAHGTSLDGTVPATITTETNGYNPAGQRISVTTPTSATATLIDTAIVSGQRQVTTTYPDASTRVELYDRAGRLVSVTGTAAFPMNYVYGVDSTGAFTQEIRVGEASAVTEWTKSYSDFAGRPSAVVLADNATIARSYYAANDTFAGRRGKLKSITQPPDSTTGGAIGVQVLTDYNAKGEAEVSALDMDTQNGVIDYAGLDRVTKTVRDVVSVVKDSTSYVTRRTTTSVWAADGSNTPSDVSTTWRSVDGLRTWTSSYGLPDSKSVTAYLGNGSRTDTATGSDGTVTVQTYLGDRQQSTVTTSPDAGNAQLGRVDYLYDGHGRLERSTDARNGATTFTYFNHDLPKSVLTTDPVLGQSGAGLDAQVTSTVYDDLGRPYTLTLPDLGEVQRRYHPTGLLYRTWGKRTQPEERTYDPQGRLKTLSTWQQFTGESSFAGTTGKATTTWNYGTQRGWLDSKVYPDATTGVAAPTSAVSYLYYPSGQLRQRTWARTPTVTTDYAYNLAGQLSGINYSDTTTDLTAIAYDRLGRRTSAIDAAGTITTGYTGLTSLLEDESYSGGVLDGLTIARTPDSLLRPDVLAVSAASYSTGINYKDGSRPDTLTATVGGVGTSHVYVYQANSVLIDTLTQKRGTTTILTTTKVFDRLNRLGSITAAPPALPNVSTTWTYNDANQRTKATEAGGEYWDYGYDDLGQVNAGVKNLAGAVPVPGHDFGYTFDQAGNLTATETNGQAATYTPDRLNRYTERTVPAFLDILGSAEPTAKVFVNLKPSTRQGTLFHRQLAVPNTTAPAYTTLSILAAKPGATPTTPDALVKTSGNAYLPQSPESFTPDLDGNIIGDGGWIYAWDAENRLKSATRSPAAYGAGAPRIELTFLYDSQSRRIQKVVSLWNGSVYVPQTTTRFLYDGWNLVAEFNGTTALRTYVWGLDLSGSMQGAGGVGGLLQVTDSTGTPASYFPVYSGNGDVTGLYNTATAQRAASYVYDPFGGLIGAYGPAAGVQPFRFSTKYEDTETATLNFGYRIFSPSLKRFISRDPMGEDGGINLYGFLENGPVNGADYLGLFDYESRPDVQLMELALFNPALVPLSAEVTRQRPAALIGQLNGLANYGANTVTGLARLLSPGGPSGPLDDYRYNPAAHAAVLAQIQSFETAWLGEIDKELARWSPKDLQDLRIQVACYTENGLLAADAVALANLLRKFPQLARLLMQADNAAPKLRLNIFGEGEAPGFLDVSTNPRWANARPATSTLPDGSASDIFIRSAPLSGGNTVPEIVRLSAPGTRITILQPADGYQGKMLLDVLGDRATVDFSRIFTSQRVAPGEPMQFVRIIVNQ